MSGKSVQEEYAPNSICFGCGPSNKEGLQIKSYRTEEGLEMDLNVKKSTKLFQV